MHARQITTDMRGQTARERSGGQHQIVIGHIPAVDPHGLRRRIDAVDRGAQHQVNPVVGVKTLGPQIEPLKRHVAQQIGLGQGRALVGGHGFGPDQRDLTLKAGVAQLGHTG